MRILFNILSSPFLLLLFIQAYRVRKKAPKLPAASGPDTGIYPDDTTTTTPYRLLVFGESTAAGVGAPDHTQALAGQLASFLSIKIGQPVHWTALGEPGVTALRAYDILLPKLPPTPPDLLIIALGANDVMELTAAATWKRHLIRLITALRNSYPDTSIIISGAPPMQVFPAFPWPLNQYAGWRAFFLNQAAASIPDTFSDLQFIPLRFDDLSHFFANDQIHPAPNGYRQWANHLIEEMG